MQEHADVIRSSRSGRWINDKGARAGAFFDAFFLNENRQCFTNCQKIAVILLCEIAFRWNFISGLQAIDHQLDFIFNLLILKLITIIFPFHRLPPVIQISILLCK